MSPRGPFRACPSQWTCGVTWTRFQKRSWHLAKLAHDGWNAVAHLASSLYSDVMNGRHKSNATTREPKLEQLLWPWRSLKHKKETPPLRQTPLGRFVAVTFISCGVINSCVFLNDLPQIGMPYRIGPFAGTAMTAMLSLPM